MGWWSADIMGGDSPLDIRGSICDMADIQDSLNAFPDGNSDVEEVKYLVENWRKVVEHFLDKGWQCELHIIYQVIGYLLIKAGAEVEKELKKLVLDSCKRDDWAKEDEERRLVIDNFHNVVDSYKGAAVPLKSSGLFDEIAKHLGK